MTNINLHAEELLGKLPYPISCYAILGGGALRAFYDKTPVADLDFFFRSEEHYQRAVRALDAAGNFQRLADKGRTAVYRRDCGAIVNLIGFAFGEPEDTMLRFDFRCCRMVAWWPLGEVSALALQDVDSIDDATNKRLVVLTNNGTERTLRRIAHYRDDYGYAFDDSVTSHLMSDAEADAADAEEGTDLFVAQPDLFDPPPAPPVAVEQVLRNYVRRVPRFSCGGY